MSCSTKSSAAVTSCRSRNTVSHACSGGHPRTSTARRWPSISSCTDSGASHRALRLVLFVGAADLVADVFPIAVAELCERREIAAGQMHGTVDGDGLARQIVRAV